MPFSHLAAALLLMAQAGESTIRIDGSPDTTFSIECGGEPLGADGVFQPPQLFTFPGGSVSCELVVLGGGQLSVEVRGAGGNVSRISTAGQNSRIRFSVN